MMMNGALGAVGCAVETSATPLATILDVTSLNTPGSALLSSRAEAPASR